MAAPCGGEYADRGADGVIYEVKALVKRTGTGIGSDDE